MITDSYDPQSPSLIELKDFYGEQKHLVNTCLVLFSGELHRYLLEYFECEVIAQMTSCRENVPIYCFTYKGRKIAFYLSWLGSTLASGCVVETWWLTGARNFVMFGSCGSLDREKTAGKYIIATEAYRGEGCSYYYMPPSDYIGIRNGGEVAAMFDELHIPYVRGRVWTVESMLRETRDLARQRREEGCVAVEMELAGVQAVCDFYGMKLYDFLEAGDILDEQSYEYEGLKAANHDQLKLFIGMDIAARIDASGS